MGSAAPDAFPTTVSGGWSWADDDQWLVTNTRATTRTSGFDWHGIDWDSVGRRIGLLMLAIAPLLLVMLAAHRLGSHEPLERAMPDPHPPALVSTPASR